MSTIRITLVDPNPTVAYALAQAFASQPSVTVVNDYFENLPEFDCMVSAANSFGLMDGGVDAAITQFFGLQLQTRVQQHILDEYMGEQPVGTSFIIETKHKMHPYLAHSPTMRVPMPIAHTDNVYCAMWATLLAVRKHNRSRTRAIRTLACPGLGTLTGRVPPEEAARQMALAYEHFLSPPRSISWPIATERQDRVIYGGDIGLHVL